MIVPYLDLKAQHQLLRMEIDTAISKICDSSGFVLGPTVSAFERSFAAYCGVEHCVGVNNGTNALMLSLKALDVGPGDEVITAANTFVATAEAIVHAGARPVLVDVDPQTRTIDPKLLTLAISQKTKAIIPVHLYGRIADMQPILAIAQKYSIAILEDAAQAHGATSNGQRAGSFGVMGAFSFYPAKNLGAFGDAGAITTNDPALNRTVRMLRDHGSAKKYHHDLIGYNARMSAIDGAVLDIKLKHLDKWNQARCNIARWYSERLDNSSVVLPGIDDDPGQVFHCFVIECEQRDKLQAYLAQHQVSTIIHYPVPIHLQPAFDYLSYRPGEFPVAEKLAGEILSLPMYPELTESQVDYVCKQINTFYHGI